MNEIMYDLIRIAIVVIMALITTYLVPYLKKLSENEKYANLVAFIRTAVTAAEQTIKGDGRGSEKKAEVLRLVGQWLNEKGIKITEEQLNTLIESAVYQMNREKPLEIGELVAPELGNK